MWKKESWFYLFRLCQRNRQIRRIEPIFAKSRQCQASRAAAPLRPLQRGCGSLVSLSGQGLGGNDRARCAIAAVEYPPLSDAQTIWAFVRAQPFQTPVQKMEGRVVEELKLVLSADSRQACTLMDSVENGLLFFFGFFSVFLGCCFVVGARSVLLISMKALFPPKFVYSCSC